MKTFARMLSSLGVRLLIPLLLTVVFVFGAYSWVSVQRTSQRLVETIHANALQTADLVKRATQHGMMLNQKDAVHETIRLLAHTPGVIDIRIYDKQGTIIFSAREPEIGTQVDMHAEACVICHETGTPLRTVSNANRMRVYRAADGQPTLGVIDPIENAPRCANAACHAHPPEQSVLGVLDVKMSMNPLDRALVDLRGEMIFVTLAMILLVGAAAVLFVRFMVTKPLRRLQEGTKRLAAGALETRIDVRSSDEVGRLGEAFNRMARDLGQARAELEGWSRRLEEEVVHKTTELQRIQKQILHVEKMTSLGKLAATVAHEINNPLSGLLTYARLVRRDLQERAPSEPNHAENIRYLESIQHEAARCGDIVRNLLVFARQRGKDFKPVHVDAVLDRALRLVKHHLEMNGLASEREAARGDDEISCDEDQIEQAVLALLMNAIEAMGPGSNGTLRVSLLCDADAAEIRIGDTGRGIPADVLPHIFEPFYSTKNEESGVGLGLAVVWGVVERHGGRIDVESEVGQGTTFRVRLPRIPKEGREPAGGGRA